MKAVKLNFPSSKVVAAIIFIVALLWILSGVLSGTGDNEHGLKRVEEITIPSVTVMQSLAQPIQQEIVLYGLTESLRKVAVKSQIDGRVSEIIAKEGDAILKGEPLLKLDMEDRAARLNEAKALLQQRKLEYKVARSLLKSGYQSETRQLEAAFALKTAEAMLEAIKLEIDKTTITAPFDGIVEKINVEEGDYLNDKGEQIATVIDQSNFLAVGQVPEQMIAKVKTGSDAYISTVNGIESTGVVTYTAKIADPLTHTFRVEIEAPAPESYFQEGVTTEIRIKIATVEAHLVPSSAFSLDEDGTIGLKSLTGDNHVKFYPIKIVKDSPEGMWVTGLPDKVRIILTGQAFLREGDKAKVAG